MPLEVPTVSCCGTHTHTPYESPEFIDTKYATDQRIRISSIPATSSTPACITAPYKWICKLDMVDTPVSPGAKPPPSTRCGTGFLINIPGSTRCVLLTAGHNLMNKKGKYTPHITITFPDHTSCGLNGSDKVFKVPERFRPKGGDEDIRADYGLIILPGVKPADVSCGFGIAAMLLDRELLETNLSVFGYPASEKTQWGSGGRTQGVDASMIRYLLQTTGGQSGSPVFMWYKGFWTVVGVHVRHENRAEWVINSAIRLNVSVMYFIMSAINHPFLNINLLHNGATLGISGPVECKPGKYGLLEPYPAENQATLFDFIPIQSYPEGTDIPSRDNEWVITSAQSRKPGTAEAVTAICTDEYLIPVDDDKAKSKVVGTMLNMGVVACSHLNGTAVLRRACEAMRLETDGSVTSLRFNKPLGVMVGGRGVIRDLFFYENVPADSVNVVKEPEKIAVDGAIKAKL